MASTNKTGNIGLSLWELNDKPGMEDFNADNRKIEQAFDQLQKDTNQNIGTVQADIKQLQSGLEEKMNGDFRLYSSLEQLGIPEGSETSMEQIVEAMWNKSILIAGIHAGNNVEVFPYHAGILTITKYNTARCKAEFIRFDGQGYWTGCYYYASNGQPGNWLGWYSHALTSIGK